MDFTSEDMIGLLEYLNQENVDNFDGLIEGLLSYGIDRDKAEIITDTLDAGYGISSDSEVLNEEEQYIADLLCNIINETME